MVEEARRRPKPGGRGSDTNVDGRRRLGRFFVSDEPEDGTPAAAPQHFPGVPRPEHFAEEVAEPAGPTPTAPRSRPRPAAADRPRPPHQ